MDNALLQTIDAIWSELPELVGEDWPQFEAQLISLKDQLTANPADEKLIHVQILHLFTKYSKAHHRLIEALNESEKQSQIFTKGPTVRGPVGNEKSNAIAQSDYPTVSRYTDISCPSQVWISAPRISLIVRLRVQPFEQGDTATELKVRAESPVRMRVESAAFDILNEPEQETAVLPDSDSPAVVFDLRPKQIGHSRINIDFLQSGNPLGTISVPIEVTAYEIEAKQEERSRQAISLGSDVSPPNFVLYISYERFQQPPSLVFTLIKEGGVGRTFHPVPLESDPATYTNQLYERLDILTYQSDPTAQAILGKRVYLTSDDVDRRLKHLGQNLWKLLIPEQLKEIYSTQREEWRDRSLIIVSDEPTIPWELLWPYDSEWEDEMPWCLTLRLSRWLRRDYQGNGNDTPPSSLRLSSMAVLVPIDSGLASVVEEQLFLLELGKKKSIKDVSPSRAAWGEVMDLLEGTDYDWLHAAAHGNFYSESPDSNSVLWLEGDKALTPESIIGRKVETHIKKRRPAFIFNACYVGRQGWELTRIGGWANRLVSAGAGMFLASLWSVSDKPALSFSKAFYSSLIDGETAAEAVRKGRIAAMSKGDPTWLAYSLYAHPNARLI